VPLPVAGERLAQPPSPENCTIREESRTTVRVSCAESELDFDATAIYVLHVFDADTRRLLASATSLTPSMLEVTNLPVERSQSGLMLSLRIMTEQAMSDATVLFSPHFVQEGNTNKEHQRYPGRAQIHMDRPINLHSHLSPYDLAPRCCSHDGAFCARAHRSSDVVVVIERAPILIACTIQIILLSVTSWTRVASRSRDSGTNDSYSRVLCSSMF